jgi:ABC-type multidrug transport system fused ATPase/permease subunit
LLTWGSTHFYDTIRGVATTRAFGWAPKDVEKNDRLLDASQRPAYLLIMVQQWLCLVLRLVVLGVATVLVSLATQLSTSAASFTGASLVTLIHFGEALTMTIRCYTQLETSIGAVARLNAFSEQVPPEDLPGEDFIPPGNWPYRGHVTISRLSASYSSDEEDADTTDTTEKSDTTSSMALRGISLEIKPGEKVAVCGRTGRYVAFFPRAQI